MDAWTFEYHRCKRIASSVVDVASVLRYVCCSQLLLKKKEEKHDYSTPLNQCIRICEGKWDRVSLPHKCILLMQAHRLDVRIYDSLRISIMLDEAQERIRSVTGLYPAYVLSYLQDVRWRCYSPCYVLSEILTDWKRIRGCANPAMWHDALLLFLAAHILDGDDEKNSELVGWCCLSLACLVFATKRSPWIASKILSGWMRDTCPTKSVFFVRYRADAQRIASYYLTPEWYADHRHECVYDLDHGSYFETDREYAIAFSSSQNT